MTVQNEQAERKRNYIRPRPRQARQEEVLVTLYPLTDLGNAERLAAAHGTTLRYFVQAGHWLHWTGARWETDDTGVVHRRAHRVVRKMTAEGERLAGPARDALLKHAWKSESHPRLQAMVEIARTLPEMPVTAEMLDRDPWLLNVRNGILDLRTGFPQSHAPKMLLTKLAPVTYDPEARCPRWEQFLREIFQEDAEVIAYVQRLVGYLLTGDTSEQAVVFLVGKGANGKSVFLETLRALCGDYARSTPFSTFLEKRGEATNDLAALLGARLVTASEVGGGQAFNTALLKQISGGDAVTCRFLHREFFTYTPAFKVLFAMNEVPRLDATSYALRRRIQLLPFRQTFYPPQEERDPRRDPELGKKLRGELSGILNWAIIGACDWLLDGLQPPRQVLDSTEALFESFDPLADFLEDACVREPAAKVEIGTLWKAYGE